MKKTRSGLMLCLLAGLAAPLPADSPRDSYPIEEYRLENGVQVLVFPDPGTPRLACGLFFDLAGLEPALAPGLAALSLEMLWEGTDRIGSAQPAREAAWLERIRELDRRLVRQQTEQGIRLEQPALDRDQRELEALLELFREEYEPQVLRRLYRSHGATRIDSGLTPDYAYLTFELPSNRLELWCLLEAQRIRSHVLRNFPARRSLLKRRLEEQLAHSPAPLFTLLHQLAFQLHPYRLPTAGTPQLLSEYLVEDVEAFLSRLLVPERMLLVAVGDVSVQEFLPLVKSYFGRLSPSGAVLQPAPPEPGASGERRAEAPSATGPRLLIAFRAPAYGSEDWARCRLLAELLAGGPESRLWERCVVRERSVLELHATLQERRAPGLLILDLHPLEPYELDELETEVQEEIQRLQTGPIYQLEIDRALQRILREYREERQDPYSLLRALATSELAGGWQHHRALPDRVSNLLAEDLILAAREFLRPRNRIVIRGLEVEETETEEGDSH